MFAYRLSNVDRRVCYISNGYFNASTSKAAIQIKYPGIAVVPRSTLQNKHRIVVPRLCCNPLLFVVMNGKKKKKRSYFHSRGTKNAIFYSTNRNNGSCRKCSKLATIHECLAAIRVLPASIFLKLVCPPPPCVCSDSRGELEIRRTTDFGQNIKTVADKIYSFGLGGRFLFASVMTGEVGSWQNSRSMLLCP